MGRLATLFGPLRRRDSLLVNFSWSLKLLMLSLAGLSVLRARLFF